MNKSALHTPHSTAVCGLAQNRRPNHRSSNLAYTLALVAIAASSILARAANAAEPIIIRATRVIPCGRENDPRGAVVTGVAITPDGRTIAAAEDDHRVTVWDVATAEVKGQFQGHADWVRSIVLAQDGTILASAGRDRALRIWNIEEQRQICDVCDCNCPLSAVCFHPNNQQLAVAGFGNTLKIINTSSGQVSQELACPCDDACTVAFSPDGSRMAVAGRRGCIRIWNVANGSQERDIAADGRRIRAIAFSPDGRRLAAAGDSQLIRIYDAQTATPVRELSTRPAKVYSLLYLNRDNLAAGGTDNRIWVWDLETNQPVAQLTGHTGTVAALACDSAAKTLVSGSYDTTVRIWNLNNDHQPTTASRESDNPAR